MFQKEVIVDCRGHLYGRLASIVAKELLSGQKIVRLSARSLSLFCFCALLTSAHRRSFARRKSFAVARVCVVWRAARARQEEAEREKRKK
jgi:hypothetical protein